MRVSQVSALLSTVRQCARGFKPMRGTGDKGDNC